MTAILLNKISYFFSILSNLNVLMQYKLNTAMKKTFALTAILLMILLPNNAHIIDEADKIIGLWLTQCKDGNVEIFKVGNKYHGRLKWATDMYNTDKTSKIDVNNPDPRLKNRPIHNFVFMNDFEYKDGIWDNGKIYDARTGESYDCFMKYVNGKIIIRAYIGMHVFGRSEEWERIK